VHRYLQGRSQDVDAVDALAGFRRFPQWMWRNADMLDFVGWLREHNQRAGGTHRPAGFYGLDLYSLHGSMQAVLAYLERVDPAAAARARARYACFEDFGDDPQQYGLGTRFDIDRSCEQEVVAQLVELQRQRGEQVVDGEAGEEDARFAAEQNALVVKNAERYYRELFFGRVNTWNLRDTHMADTLDALLSHLGRRGGGKLVVWAHNSHLGDARATEAAARREINLGQLARERHPGRVVNVGFTTHSGSVSAASKWDGPVERKRVRPALDGSYEELLHAVGEPRFFLDLRQLGEAGAGLSEPRLERAIGVVYQPETERWSHYFDAELPRQFDLLLHFDETRAVEPLERTARWEAGELPETFPYGV
jgi:erythromycin esterase-like protein